MVDTYPESVGITTLRSRNTEMIGGSIVKCSIKNSIPRPPCVTDPSNVNSPTFYYGILWMIKMDGWDISNCAWDVLVPHRLRVHFNHKIHSYSGQIILSIAYDINPESDRDIYFNLSEKALLGLNIAATPGSFLVDVMPFCKLFCDLHSIALTNCSSEIRPCLVPRCWVPAKSQGVATRLDRYDRDSLQSRKRTHCGYTDIVSQFNLTPMRRTMELLLHPTFLMPWKM